MTRKDILKKYGYCWMSNVDLRKETITWRPERKNTLDIVYEIGEKGTNYAYI